MWIIFALQNHLHINYERNATKEIRGNYRNYGNNNSSNNMPGNRPHPSGNSRYSGNNSQFERITRSKSNAMKTRDTRGLSIHEIDEEDEEWLFKRRMQSQREGNSNNNNNNNNNNIINRSAVNNNKSQHRNNNLQSNIVENRNNNMNEVLHHEVAIQHAPERVVNDQNNGERAIRQDRIKHTGRDTTYKPYSRSYTNFRTEPIRTRSTTRAEAAQKSLEPI